MSCELSAAKKHLYVIEDYQTAIFPQVVEELGYLGFDVLGDVGFVREDLQEVGECCIEVGGKAKTAINYVIKVGFDLFY